MLRKIALALAYMKAPRTTLAARHPRQIATALAAREVLRRSPFARKAAGGLLGVGAAAVLLPLLGMRMLRR